MLSISVEEDVKVKEHISTLLTKENLTILLSELKIGEADKSFVLLKTFIENIEGTLGAKWEDVKAELIVGDSNKKFNPNKTATRAVAVAVVFRLFNR